jgi:hypothetical protein
MEMALWSSNFKEICMRATAIPPEVIAKKLIQLGKKERNWKPNMVLKRQSLTDHLCDEGWSEEEIDAAVDEGVTRGWFTYRPPTRSMPSGLFNLTLLGDSLEKDDVIRFS